ncbi:hypothetical protein HETIRDRAFT_389239 [Heterobasidion irregulare TC 32-1]|uniref:Uncharacterized protein n=1 Tax=Heterobasidion irregulare (strain TC 32-1) TaxID=747525 RepID=W4JVP7_HETIT|nr:uncharacterized protein HETIRDRAFT_389239 [Heterobasidion irregulare TC 32-1]ETW77643.1 hypothetical protein HETIRDRAFT_389239 [Heterobasidion irregulare TC 32-1]
MPPAPHAKHPPPTCAAQRQPHRPPRLLLARAYARPQPQPRPPHRASRPSRRRHGGGRGRRAHRRAHADPYAPPTLRLSHRLIVGARPTPTMPAVAAVMSSRTRAVAVTVAGGSYRYHMYAHPLVLSPSSSVTVEAPPFLNRAHTVSVPPRPPLPSQLHSSPAHKAS